MDIARTLLDCEESDNAHITELRTKIIFNYYGNINNEFLWESLTPISEGGGCISLESEIGKEIVKAFGDFFKFYSLFSETTKLNQEKGWTWLAYNKEHDDIEIRTT